MELIATAVRSRKCAVAITDTGKIGIEACKPLGNETDHLSLPLHATAHRDHAGRQDGSAVLLERHKRGDETGDAARNAPDVL